MTSPVNIHDLDAFIATRDALHRVAEHVLAKARYVDDGGIRLMAFEGGFATPLLAGRRRIRIAGGDLVVDEGADSRRAGLTTVDEAASFVGIEPGLPSELYQPATPLDGHEPLQVDRGAAHELGAWYGFTAEALHRFAAEVGEARPSEINLWPEHFDQAFSTEDDNQARRANYGASPGDAGHPEPYLYVGPWNPVAANAFWNASHFNGAVLPVSTIVAAADPLEAALRFLRAGRALLVAAGHSDVSK